MGLSLTSPRSGDQHKANGAVTANPFEEVRPHISEYTAQEIATLQARLNRKLGPEFIATRQGPGGTKVAYLPAEKAINLANEVFGFNGWSSSIQGIQIDFVDENPSKGTISLGLSVTVRVTLRDGTYHEDTGYGGIENCKSKISAFEKAKKEGTTDALKRALRNFGNVLGNCIYDKDYIAKIAKVKAGQGRWDVNELHRHEDFREKKEEAVPIQTRPPAPAVAPIVQPPPSLIPEDSFDVDDFGEADLEDFGNADGIMLPPDTDRIKALPDARPGMQSQVTPSKPPQQRPPGPSNAITNVNGMQRATPQPNNASFTEKQNLQAKNVATTSGPPSRSSSPGLTSQHLQPPVPPPVTEGGARGFGFGFYSARDADGLDGNNMPTGSVAVNKFNPHAESPSIPKTSTVDHSKSIALGKGTLKHEPLVPVSQLDSPRAAAIRNGATRPGTSPAGGPRMTSAYRPPTRHGPVTNGSAATHPTTSVVGVKRPPLNDLSNIPNGNGAGEDTKRPRIGPGLPGGPVVPDAENT